MKVIKLMASMLAISMIVSGLGIMAMGMEDEAPEIVLDPNALLLNSIEPPEFFANSEVTKTYGTIPGYEPHSVQRTTLVEDYTEWACSPCAGHNPEWTAAIDTVGYDVVAPSYVHVWWPSAATDAVFNVCNVDGSVQERVNYYGILGVPDCFVDGGDINTGQTAATYVSAFNAAAAVPSPLIIDTAGSMINGFSLDGTINLYIEASDAVASTNLRAFAYLWETNINRPLWDPVNGIWDASPYPNGETELDWAVWDILPDGGAGEPIWTAAGAAPGDWVSLSYPLTLGDDWVIDDIGCTVFVQDMVTKEVYQAEVELFDNLAPDVTMVTPTGAAEQVLSGDVTVEWTATDFEDDPDTGLDIDIQYSANGGFVWTSIYSGVDNNVAPFTYSWDTTSVTDGIGYMLRVKATDSLGNYKYATSAECFSIMNTPNDEWYFQFDGPYDLNINPAELSRNELATTDITDAGDFQLGSWETTQTFADNNINGDWTFKAYGKTPNAGYNPLEAYLYAKIFSSSNLGTPLYVTGLDNENVGLFQTNHEFVWTETLSGNIPAGDSLIVEIWLEAVGGPYPAYAGQTINEGFDSAATPWTSGIWYNSMGTEVMTYRASNGNLGGYVDVQLNDATSGSSTVEDAGGYWQQSFTTGFSPFEAELNLDYKCFQVGVDLATMTVYAFIDTFSGPPVRGNEVWYQDFGGVTNWISSGPIDVSNVVNSDTTYYLKIAFRHDSINRGDGDYNVGFDNVLVTFDQPSPIFYMEYDYGMTQSSVAPTIGTGGGPVLPAYDIPIPVGAGAGDWVFVSFPYVMSGDIQTVLGSDSGTHWDIAKWYDASTQSWKTYSTLGAGQNDLVTINQNMGVWLRLTASDGVLTTSSTGDYSATPVPISMLTGWNLVGYPSDTARTASVALTGASATWIATYQATAPYIVDTSNLAGVTMTEGNAYWVYVTADGTWNVQI